MNTLLESRQEVSHAVRRPAGLSGVAVVVAHVLLFILPARAFEPLTIDFPLTQTTHASHAGLLQGVSERKAGSTTIIEIPFFPVDQDINAYVTVVFRDQPNESLRARWIAGIPSQSRTLVRNLMEGVDGWNQRTIEIPDGLLGTLGSLEIESQAEFHPVKRIHITWATPGVVYASGAGQSVTYVQSERKAFSQEDFLDSENAPVADSVKGESSRAMLQDKSESLNDGVKFVVPIQGSPKFAVLRVQVLGAALNASMSVTVNKEQMPAVSLEAPDLDDPGYLQDYGGELNFAGWREASIVLPFGALRRGENEILIQPMPGSYVRASMIEIRFDPLTQESLAFDMQGLSNAEPAASEASGEPAVVTVPEQ